jgi:ribonuclease HII
MTRKFDLSLLPEAPDLRFEKALWEQGCNLVAGLDEAGRGPLAGPVSAAVVILPAAPDIASALHGVNDSKQMTAPEREYWAARIKEAALYYGIGFASAAEIDEQGIIPALFLAVDRALAQIPCPIEHILVDYLQLSNCPVAYTALVKGDARSLSIAAASILAKTARDEVMRSLDLQFPGYGFARNKGYGTSAHLEALSQLGPCPIHRRSFRPLYQPEGQVRPQLQEELE